MTRTLKLAFVGLLAAGCAAVTVDLPSITESPTGNRDTGRVVWHDLITSTPEASRKFYGELFGWTFEAPGVNIGFGEDDTYMLIRHNGRLIGGMVDANTLGADGNVSQWITVISSDDIVAAVAAVETGGGETLTPPTSLASRGELAVVQDANRAIFAIVQTRAGDPPEYEPGLNDFLWDELWTSSVDRQIDFYKRVFDYDETVHNIGDTAHRIMNADGEPRVGIMQNPFPDESPVWVSYLRVADPADIASRVEALGGAVLVPAQDSDVGGSVALIAGPSGAGIALQTWPASEGDE